MADVFTYENGADSLLGLAAILRTEGDKVAPRGVATRELRNVVIEVIEPHEPLMLHMGRKQNTKLASLEALQLIGGFSSFELMRAYAPNTVQFGDGGYFHGAYGPRLRGQMPKIIKRLRDDPHTRQAIATVWDPMHDLHVDGIHDYPCTVYLSWCIRDGELLQTTHMRSNDIWWGWTYDLFQFTQLQLAVARNLGLPAGKYVHYADSLHMYDRDIDASYAIHSPDRLNPSIGGIGLDGHTWEGVAERARQIAFGDIIDVDELTESERWHFDVLHGS